MKIKVKIETKSPLLVSEEFSRIWNKSQKRDKNGTSYIPGSALKGAFRETADTLPNYKKEVSDLFGESHTKMGKLQFSKLVCYNPSYVEKTHVVIDRKTRTSSYQRLYSTNALSSGNVLEGYIYFDEQLTDREKELLELLTSLVKKIGGMKSAGYGSVDIFFEYEDNNQVNQETNKKIYDNYALLVLEPLEPFLTVKERSKKYMYKSSKIINGETVRGAYANKLAKNPYFKNIIFNEEVKFPTLFPSKEEIVVAPTPFTTMKEKYRDNPEELFDLTIPKIIEKEINKEQLRISLEDISLTGERLENASGYLDYFNHKIISVESDTKQYTQTSVSRKTRATKSGEMRSYITEYYDKMVGIIRSTKKEYFEALSEIDYITIGNSKTRGFGKMKARILPLDDLKEKFKENINSFTCVVNSYIKPEKVYIPLLLTSDLIIPVNKTLDEIFEDKGFKINQQIYRKDKFTSWNVRTNNIKTAYETIKSGAVIILESEDINCVDKVWQMFLDGLGHRTGSGFGSFLVVDFSKIKTL